MRYLNQQSYAKFDFFEDNDWIPILSTSDQQTANHLTLCHLIHNFQVYQFKKLFLPLSAFSPNILVQRPTHVDKNRTDGLLDTKKVHCTSKSPDNGDR